MEIRLLIVDDEIATREKLLKRMAWNELGIAEVRQAESGAQALEICRSYTPNILLTDIRMARMNGIELTNQLAADIPGLRVIFISGYTDKEYFKSAINLKAVNYIEKPINIDELSQTIRMAIAQIQTESDNIAKLRLYENYQNNQRNSQLATQLSCAIYSEDQCLFELNREVPNIQTMDFFVSLVVRVIRVDGREERETVAANLRSFVYDAFSGQDAITLCTSLGRDVSVFLLGRQPYDKISRYSFINNRSIYLCDKCMLNGITIVIGVGPFVDSWQSLCKSHDAAVSAVEQTYFQTPGSISYYTNSTVKPFKLDTALVDTFAYSLKMSASTQTKRFIYGIASSIKGQQNVNVTDVRKLFLKLALKLSEVAREDGVKLSTVYASEHELSEHIRSIEFFNDLEAFVLKSVEEYYEQVPDDDYGNPAIQTIIRFINKNHADPNLDILDISSISNFSQTYVSRLFHDVTGKTIKCYITNLRMDKAKALLLDPSVRVNDIARLVGYRNGNYFSNCFRKTTGYSPSQYRDKF